MRGMNRSASNHLPINGLYGSSFETAAGRAGGSGEQSSNCAYVFVQWNCGRLSIVFQSS